MELKHFLNSVPNEKFRLLFKYQAYLGLRIGEVCKLRIGKMGNIDFYKCDLTLKTEKARQVDTLLIPFELFKETTEFITRHIDEIKAANGYVFFKHENNTSNSFPYIDANYVRNVFVAARKKSGLDSVYDYSEENPGRKQRALHRLTTHSLRHYAITHFAKSTNGNIVLASRFARHAKPETTMCYIAKDHEQLYKEIDLAFSDQFDKFKSIIKSYQ